MQDIRENVMMLMATQTGTAEEVASEVIEALKEAGVSVTLYDLADSAEIGFLRDASCILGVVSTWGDGEPPDDAVPFFEKLSESEPLGLGGVPISVFGLGDSGYDLFCECGKQLERELLRHGGAVVVPRLDGDVWYEEELKSWIDGLRHALGVRDPVSPNHES
ncbi:MAG: flavodoxin domain-containing protein [Verrucomicrobiales bacterium]